jgi:DNA-binding response OmpR family regulator
MIGVPMTASELSPAETEEEKIIILVVEDEEFLRNLLRISLEKEGYGVCTARDGVEALELYAAHEPDLVLLDIMMPRMDGFAVCQELRKRSDIPVVMLTALNSADDVVHGFDLGADDFITKPFTFKEVGARIQAILRRVLWARERPTFQIMVIGDVQLNDETHEVRVRRHPVHLTPIEYQLLRYLMSHADRPIAKEILFREVWGYDFTGGTNLVEVAMRRLREKIEQNPSEPVYLITVRGAGYKFSTPESNAT